ncbi:MAG: LysR family transcriptional regulator [Parasphingorhabdus sp.]
MYKHLQSIAAFVAVAETGAFNKAADKLGVNASVVSHHVSKLEEYLGATLIYRTTRKLSLSEHGRRLFEISRVWMDNTNQALDVIMDAQEEAVGALRVALPAFIPDPRIEVALLHFGKLHPNVSLSLFYSDQVSDLLEDDFDLSLRIGTLSDSSFMRRKLSEVSNVLVASPELLTRCGTPETPDELEKIPFIFMKGTTEKIVLTKGGDKSQVAAENCQIETNNIYGAFAAAENGLGVAGLPLPLCEQALANGTLVRLLSRWQLPKFVLQAIWPDVSRRSSLTKRLVRHLSTVTNTS